jgi:Ca2+-binding RTX toxin-like protein
MPIATAQIPTVGINLAGINDWTAEHPFLDRFKTAREWIASGDGVWDTGIKIGTDANGWPTTLPAGVKGMTTIAGVDPLSEWPSGRYIVVYEGKGAIDYMLTTSKVVAESHQGFDVVTVNDPSAAGVQSLFLTISATDPADPVHNIQIVREDQYDEWQAGEIFNPEFLAKNQDWRELRMMDWMNTNQASDVNWADRPNLDSASWATGGVPVEIMVDLANRTGADPWFNMPHMASDGYILQFATYVHDHLDPRLKAHVEYSNEVWNWQFEQSHYALEEADKRWAVDSNQNGVIDPGEHIGDGWMQFSGMRTAQTMAIWTEVFGAETGQRLDRVIATQTGWLGLEDPLLNAPLYVAEGNAAPYVGADSYAVTGYFNGGLYDSANVAAVLAWAQQGAAGLDKAFQQLEFGNQFDDAGQSLADLKAAYAYHAAVALAHGLDLTMYESGAHLISSMYDAATNAALTAFFAQLQNDPRMGELYAKNIAAYEAVGGTLFNQFNDVGTASNYGYWGALDSIYQDASARWDALRAANAGLYLNWEYRDANAFANGSYLPGTTAGDVILGTEGGDNLLGLGGDDVLVGNGGSDLVSGGAGNDVLYLDDYANAAASSGTDTGFGGDGNDQLWGYGGRDYLYGGSGDDFLVGNDLASSAAGFDTMYGGDGADTLYVGIAGNAFMDGGAGADKLYGGILNDYLRGGTGNDFLNGNAGGDNMSGGNGDDQYYLSTSADVVNESAGGGFDTVFSMSGCTIAANVERLYLLGTANYNANGRTGQGDFLAGNSGNNIINGMTGDDVIRGGLGNDRLTGGGGLDVFQFLTLANSSTNMDTITDFNASDDTIQLDNFCYSALGAVGGLAAGMFNFGTAASQADDRIIYSAATGALFYDADGTGALAAIQFATLTGAPLISAADFVVV